MTYAELFRILWRRLPLIAAPVLVSALISLPQLFGATAQTSSGYSTEIRYSASQKLDIDKHDGDYTDIWLASEHTVDALTDWARSSSFRGEIRQRLGDAAGSMEDLSIAADNARSVGLLYLSHPSGDSLSAIAEAAMIVLASRSQGYFPQLGGEPAQVTFLAQPAVVPAAPAMSSRLLPLMQIAAALFIGLALALVAEFMDPRIHHADDLRRQGFHLLGSVPRQRS